jgi:Trk-type K+ transport system membrane component
MQLELGFLYLAIWVMMLWLGSVSLEATGMERSRAHFQALSALSGTGFTTKDAETVVNHSTRRWIVTWLMFFGNAGFITILILIIVSVGTNMTNISTERIVLVSVFIGISLLFVWLGMMDRVSNTMVRWLRKSRFLKQDITDWDILHREGDYGVFRIALQQNVAEADNALSTSPFWRPSIGVLAIERDHSVLPFPGAEVKLGKGDMLLCYGKVKEIMGLTAAGQS